MSLILLENVTVDTDGAYQNSLGYQGMLLIDGNLGGGTISIEILGPKGGDLNIQNQAQNSINQFSITGAIALLSLPAGVKVRAKLSGSTGANLTVLLA